MAKRAILISVALAVAVLAALVVFIIAPHGRQSASDEVGTQPPPSAKSVEQPATPRVEAPKASPTLGPSASGSQAGSSVGLLAPGDVIRADIRAQNTHDWSTFLALRSESDYAQQNRYLLEKLRGSEAPQDDFFANIISARLVAAKPLPPTMVSAVGCRAQTVYYVAVNYTVATERGSLRNGINYRLYGLTLENSRWAIVEVLDTTVEGLRMLGIEAVQ